VHESGRDAARVPVHHSWWCCTVPANFQLAMLFHSRLRVRHGTYTRRDGRTNRQTDDSHWCIMPSPYGGI